MSFVKYIDDKDVCIQVYSECDGHSIQVLNADGDRVRSTHKHLEPSRRGARGSEGEGELRRAS